MRMRVINERAVAAQVLRTDFFTSGTEHEWRGFLSLRDPAGAIARGRATLLLPYSFTSNPTPQVAHVQNHFDVAKVKWRSRRPQARRGGRAAHPAARCPGGEHRQRGLIRRRAARGLR